MGTASRSGCSNCRVMPSRCRKMSDTGREAKFYSLTRKGRTELGSEEASWRRLTDAVGLILAAEGDPS